MMRTAIAFVGLTACGAAARPALTNRTTEPDTKLVLGPVTTVGFHVELVQGKPVTVIESGHTEIDHPPHPSTDEIAKIAERRLRALHDCFRARRAKGTTTVTVILETDGNAQVMAASQGQALAVDRCINEPALTWHGLPIPGDERGPHQRRYSFELTAPGEKM